jgi:cytochrome bd-type quinol oxidase subunit 2
MKKYLIICIIIISLFLSLPGFALAQGSNLEDGLILFEDNTILPTANIEAVIAKLINAALTLAGLVLVGIFLYGGTVWMLALGDETKVQKAKSAMVQGVIGLLVIVMSYSIANWILTALNSATGSSL